nr:MAG TPA: hypothetical protein [Caudoviricetes sp.]
MICSETEPLYGSFLCMISLSHRYSCFCTFSLLLQEQASQVLGLLRARERIIF